MLNKRSCLPQWRPKGAKKKKKSPLWIQAASSCLGKAPQSHDCTAFQNFPKGLSVFSLLQLIPHDTTSYFRNHKTHQIILLFQELASTTLCATCVYCHVSLFATPWAVAHQAPLSRNYPGTNTGLPFPPTGLPPHPGIKPTSLRPPTLAGRLFFLPLLVTWTQYILGDKLKVTQSCPTLCNPMDCVVHGILQARILGGHCLSLLQGIVLTQESNPGFPHCGRVL